MNFMMCQYLVNKPAFKLRLFNILLFIGTYFMLINDKTYFNNLLGWRKKLRQFLTVKDLIFIQNFIADCSKNMSMFYTVNVNVLINVYPY